MLYNAQIGSETDIGGGRENQDDCFHFVKPEHGLIVAVMLDGHGREVGKIAANSARQYLEKFCADGLNLLLTDPKAWLIEAHNNAHYYIKQSFKTELEELGFETMEDIAAGYLLKRKPNTQSWSCVHGGSSSTMLVLLKNNLYIANVGDSSAILSTNYPVLTSTCINYIAESALSSTSPLAALRGSLVSQYMALNPDGEEPAKNTLVITAEHSPESPYEFYRLREFRARETDPNQPSLLVVYDSPSHEKPRCNPVFEVDEAGQATVTNQGK